ncbi:MAG: alpha/beta hydrolase family protein [Terriglobales bacterium]
MFDSLDQAGAKFPATSIEKHGVQVVIQASEIRAGFIGTLTADALTGTWSQGGMRTPLAFHREARAVSQARPQEPKPPFPYRSINVTVPSTGGIRLAGTLTVPPGRGPFPAAILIAGSGPNARNEDAFGHKIFLVLADALTRHGLAVLRMDKRGIGQSGGNYATATMADYAQDVAADFAFLRKRNGIDPHKIGLIGHSEGGEIAPMVAANHPQIAFVVILAGPAMPGTDIVVDQIRALATARGVPPARVARAAQLERIYVQAIASAPTLNAAPGAVRAAVAAGKLPRAILKHPRITSEYYGVLRFDPEPYLRRLRCPVLALNGSKDTQVPAAVNVPALRAALKNDPHATVVELPGLNHLFQPAKTGLPSEYASIALTFSPAALQRIERWLASVVGTKP